MPDPGLLIRTGGEMRLSNYLLWQSAYTEIFVTPVLWPEFTPEHFDQAMIDFAQRNRRWGGD
jgi:undecaprenyl diphosphate synthase